MALHHQVRFIMFRDFQLCFFSPAHPRFTMEKDHQPEKNNNSRKSILLNEKCNNFAEDDKININNLGTSSSSALYPIRGHYEGENKSHEKQFIFPPTTSCSPFIEILLQLNKITCTHIRMNICYNMFLRWRCYLFGCLLC